MNKTKTNILAAVIGILLGSMMAHGALAQDLSSAEIQIEVSSGCDWDGTPYASNLTVSDNDICVLTGVHNVGAYNVYVEDDADSSGNNLPLQRAGGHLVIGDGTVDTDITFGGIMTMDGILEIGVTGNPAFSANLQIDGTSAISSTGSDGIVTIYANSSDDHTIELGSALTIGSATTTGTFTNNDDATTNTMTSVNMYGEFNNLAGTITLTGTLITNGASDVDNDGILNLGTGNSYFNDTTTFDNSGTFTVPTVSTYVYYGHSNESTTIINSGTFTEGYHSINGGTFANTGTMNVGSVNVGYTGVFNNNSGGDINLTYHMLVSSGGAAIYNNNPGSSITIPGTTYLYGNSVEINNFAGSTFEVDYIQFGIDNGVTNGGTFNNYGALTYVTPQTPAMNIYRGGNFYNQSTGTVTVPTNIIMNGDPSYIATITNDNTTDANALTVTGTITMVDYSDLDNSGNLTVNGASNIILGTENTTAETINSTITNNATGYLDLNGTTEAIFDEDIAVNNAGIIDVAVAATLNDTASINQTAGDFNAPSLELTDTTSGEADFTMSGGTVDISGITYIYDGGTANNNEVNVNGGTYTTNTLRVGETGGLVDGGQMYVDGTGNIVVNGTVSVFSGILDVLATNTATTPLLFTGNADIKGSSSEEGYIYMRGSGTASTQRIYVYEYGNYLANNGETNMNETELHIYGNASDKGYVYVGSGVEMHNIRYVFIGNNTIIGGELENEGYMHRNNGSDFCNFYLYNDANIINRSTGVLDIGYYGSFLMYNGSSPGTPSTVANDSGGIIHTFYLQTYNVGDVFNNSGTFNLYYRGTLGYQNGGTFNNYGQTNLNGSSWMALDNAATFNNEEDAVVSGTGELRLNHSSSIFYQKEGTDAGAQTPKVDVSRIAVSSGLFENADYVDTGVLDIDTNGIFNGVLDATGDLAPDDAQDSITLVSSGGGAWVNGGTAATPGLKIEGNATDSASLQIEQVFDITATGVVKVDGTMALNGTGTNLFETYGEFYSGNYSVISLAGAPGILTHTGSYTEFANTVTAQSFEMNGGYMCIGDYSSTFPSGTCNHNTSNPTITLTGTGDSFDASNTARADIANNLTLSNGSMRLDTAAVVSQTSDSTIDVQNNNNIVVDDSSSFLETNGTLDIQGSGLGNHGYLRLSDGGDATLSGTTNNIGSVDLVGGGSGGETRLTVNAAATLNLNDTHTSAPGNAVMSVGLTDVSGAENIYNYGTINMNSGGTQDIYFGVDTTTSWNVDGMINWSGGSWQHTNGSTGDVRIYDTGIIYVQDDSNADLDVDINGNLTIGGKYIHGHNGPHGVYVDAQMECQDLLTVSSDGLLDVGTTGEMTVQGSTTDVYGNVELDGTLNAGDLTVYSGGVISSGDGGFIATAQGCGVNQEFGCGTSTNFEINATSLDVQSGGYIASDGVSERDVNTLITTAHGGSFGGQGIDAGSSPGATHGATKISTPDYGERGENASDAISGLAGGGVEINVTGDIIIDGTVSSNAGPVTYDLAYDTQTADFTVGATVSGATGEGIIIADNDAGTTGTLTIILTTPGFVATETITDNADGAGSASVTSSEAINSATGSGGTVIITQDLSSAPTTAIFTGSGTISANGGDATYPGGGGRISIDSILLDDPDFGSYDFGETTSGTVEALGGTDGASAYAAAGTIVYLGDSHNADDTLIIDQGGSAPTSSTVTDLADTPTFDRIEVAGNAIADLTGVTTQVCYGEDTDITGLTCSNYDFPDKPDSLHIETTSNGTSSGDPTEEPGYIAGKGNGVSDTAYDVADITPVFAMYFRNPTNTTGDFDEVEIQVASDTNFSTLLWDATGVNSITLTTPVSNGEWTEDIEYAGSALSLSTTYYVRARFIDNDTTNAGLWTHADYNDQYKFEISSYTDLYIDNCNGVPANTSLVITQDGTTTGDDMSILSGGRYAYGSCDVHMDTSESDWEVYVSMAAGETGLEHTTLPTNEIDHIQNTSSDCTMVTDGTGTEQEWGYNVTTYPSGNASEQVVDDNVNSNTDCRRDTATYPDACGNTGTDGYYNDSDCFFNLENLLLVGRDTVFDTDLGTAASLADGRFTINIHANVGTMETAGDYDTVVEVTLNTNP